MEGAVVLWLPKFLMLKQYRHPWSRTYNAHRKAKLVILALICFDKVCISPETLRFLYNCNVGWPFQSFKKLLSDSPNEFQYICKNNSEKYEQDWTIFRGRSKKFQFPEKIQFGERTNTRLNV